MANPKVFEFAKEVGLETLALMAKIREWNLPVKSHMQELTPDLIEQINVRLNPPSKTEEKKKTVAKKKAPAKKAAEAAAAVPASAATAAPKVVRRKAGAEESKETPAVEAAVIESEVPPAKVETQKTTVRRSVQVEEKTEVLTARIEPKLEEPTPQLVAQVAQPVESTVPAKEATMPAVEEAEKKSVGPARKKEVVVGQSGHASPERPSTEVGRRNIVGRMDLSRVTPPPGSYGQGRPPGPGGGAPRPQGARPPMGGGAPRPGGFTGGRNIRAGFVAQPDVFEQPTDDHARKSRFEDRERRAPRYVEPVPAAVPPNLEEEAKAAFNAAEFRKRELVFQPKKKKGMLAREALQTQITKPKASKRVLKVSGTMKLSAIADEMGLKVAQLTKALMTNGVMATPSTDLDFDTIALIVPEFGWEAQNTFKTADEILKDSAFGELEAETVHRPPVVTVMGHVDHGKTSLLDAIRKTDVASGEAGGITQHIGAYQVKLDGDHVVTFLDTPGHAAFTAMRARGANVTDIVVIVVAADDGVMPQTIEAISHAKAANVPIIIAVNKMDKPGVNPDKIKQQLTEYEIVPEEWGGSNIFCPVSALKKTGVKELLEQILLVAEMLELKANPKRSGTGVVIESRLEKGRGCVATILVQDGTMAVGDMIVAGTASGRIRSLMNDRGERVNSAGPGAPVEVLGLDEAPGAGDKVDIVKDEKTLAEVLEVRRQAKIKAENPSSKMSLEELLSKSKQGEQKTLNIILKCDVMGSSEAIQGMFQKLGTDEVKIRLLHTAVGGITESDVLLAKTSKAIIVGFNTRPDNIAAQLAKQSGIEIRTYSIVYELMDDMKRIMSGLLEPEIVEQVHGRAEVRNTFTVPKIGMIAGCAVVDGKVARGHLVRLIRDGVVYYQGKISSLKRFKDDAKEVSSGFECGIGIENYNDLKVGDVIEAYTRDEVRRSLDGASATT